LIQAFACTSETLAGFQSTFPKTLGRSLVSGFLPADALDASRSDGLKKPQGMVRCNPAVCHKTYLERIGRFLRSYQRPRRICPRSRHRCKLEANQVVGPVTVTPEGQTLHRDRSGF